MTAPKVGDRVRVVLEGEVTDQDADGFDVGDGVWANSIAPDAPHVVSVEVLPPPEPEWKPGDVVRDDLGHVFRRHADRWHNFDGHSFGHDYPIRPLTRLVPEGQS